MMTPPQGHDAFSRNGKSVIRFRPAWRSFWGSAIAGACVLTLWMVKKSIFDGVALSVGIPAELSALGLIIGLGPIALAVLYQRYTRSFEIEEGRTIRRTVGFIARKKREFSLSDKIQADMEQSISARVLNYGTIRFWTGDDRSQLEWANAPDPDEIISYINALKSPGKHDTVALANAGAGPAPFSVAGTPASPAHVAIPAGVALTPPTLEEAKKTKSTHYGPLSDQLSNADLPRMRYKTPMGHYIDNRDGTVSHQETGLMWIRAPWGMVWNGAGFQGEPIPLKWHQAVELFGGDRMADFSKGFKLEAGDHRGYTSIFDLYYQTRKCAVHFAGDANWQQPTALELDLMSPHMVFMDYRKVMGDEPSGENSARASALFENRKAILRQMIPTSVSESAYRNDYESLWSGGSALKRFMKKLYPELTALKDARGGGVIWSGSGYNLTTALAYGGWFPLSDMRMKTALNIVFVRYATVKDFINIPIEDVTL